MPDFVTAAMAFSFAINWNSWNLVEIRWFIFKYFSAYIYKALRYFVEYPTNFDINYIPVS